MKGRIAQFLTLAGALGLIALAVSVAGPNGSIAFAETLFCEGSMKQGGDAPSGNTVTALWIKAGTTCLGPFGNGDHGTDANGDACYRVSGVGTGSASAEKIGEGQGDICKDISHIEVAYEADPTTPPPTDTPEPTPTDTPEPTPTDTPEEPTPTPTDDPEVTPTPTPEDPTPTPTNTPEPTPTPTDPPRPTPTATELPKTGTGDGELPTTADPFSWEPVAWQEDGYPDNLWLTHNGSNTAGFGDEIVLLQRGSIFAHHALGASDYEVTGVMRVEATDTWVVDTIDAYDDLVVMTCSGYNVTTGEWRYRVIVFMLELP